MPFGWGGVSPGRDFRRPSPCTRVSIAFRLGRGFAQVAEQADEVKAELVSIAFRLGRGFAQVAEQADEVKAELVSIAFRLGRGFALVRPSHVIL